METDSYGNSGVPTEGRSTHVFGADFNIESAVNSALIQAGEGYDLLINTEISYTSKLFVLEVRVRGLAIRSEELRASLGEDEFTKWCMAHHVLKMENTVNHAQ